MRQFLVLSTFDFFSPSNVCLPVWDFGSEEGNLVKQSDVKNVQMRKGFPGVAALKCQTD